MSRIGLDGITLAVGEWPDPREADTDKTVVCVHGLFANLTCWASVAGVLSPEYRVIAYDLRGLGDSDTIPAGRLVTVAGSNHYTVLLGETPDVKSALRAFLAGG